MRSGPFSVFVLLVFLLSCAPDGGPPSAERSADEVAVLDAVQRFFDTMTARDAEGARAVLDSAGDFVSVRWDENGERIVRRSTNEVYLDGLPGMGETFVERMWEAEVRIHGPIATVWAPYDFYVDGEFSHCGVDAFQLLDTDDGWVITGGTYTVEREDCAESPLGPLEDATTRRQAEVAEAGSMVMPFDLDRSTHVFEKTDFGGIQIVSSDDGDAEQIRAIRDHLAEEAERFARGDFHDPAMIHGDNMAGMHALVTGHDRLVITFRDVGDGGEIRYESEDAALIEAIHEWFDAQVSDHAEHAQPHR